MSSEGAASGSSPLPDDERSARMTMSWIAEPGDLDACRLVRDHTAEAVVARIRDRGLDTPKGAAWAARLREHRLDDLLVAAARVGARYVAPGDHEWSHCLDDLRRVEALPDRRCGEPFGLWVRGPQSLRVLDRLAVAVVGSRAATDYGDHVAGLLAAGCAARGSAVVSGGAYGIDAAAHRGALAAGGCTVAVLASGIDRLYPTGERAMLHEIAETGLLVSEAAPGCTPTRSRFLVRNRLIAAMAAGTVVVEAALRSGSLNTARWARDLGRPVMGVPGPVTSMLSAGVHELLRQPEAVLVTDADEVLELVAPIGEISAPPKRGPLTERDRLDDLSRALLEAMPKVSPAPTARLAARAGVTPGRALGLLQELAARNLVVSTTSGWRLPPDGPDAP